MARTAARFQPIRNENISETIAAQVRKEILRGGYKPGERLPSERELALAFGVNRITVREALLKLQALGLVSIRQGSGVEVREYKDTGTVDLLVHMLTTPDSEGRYDARALLSVVELSRTLYLQAVELALARMTPEEAAHLDALLEHQETLGDDVDAFVRNSMEIHKAIFQGTHSIALRLLFNTIREVFEAYSSPFRAVMESELKGADDRGRLLGWFRRVRSAAARRDAKSLRRLVEAAFEPENGKRFMDFVAKKTF